METSNLLNAEFKTLIIRMLNKLRGKVEEFTENLNRDRTPKNKDRKVKKNQSEKNTVTEMNNIVEGITSRLDEAED